MSEVSNKKVALGEQEHKDFIDGLTVSRTQQIAELLKSRIVCLFKGHTTTPFYPGNNTIYELCSRCGHKTKPVEWGCGAHYDGQL